MGRMLRLFQSWGGVGHQQGTVLLSGALDSFLGKHAVYICESKSIRQCVHVCVCVCVCVHPCVYNVLICVRIWACGGICVNVYM